MTSARPEGWLEKTPFGFHPDPVMRDIYIKVLDIEVMAGHAYLKTDGAVEPTDAYDRIEAALREVRDDLVLLHQLCVPDPDDEDE